MKLTDTDKVWAPLDEPDYLCVLKVQWDPPKNRETFLRRQSELLARLVAEANPGEVANGNRMLLNNLSQAVLDGLPGDLFNDPRTCRYLIHNPAELGSNLQKWRDRFEEVADLPVMDQAEANQTAADLCLEVFLDRLM